MLKEFILYVLERKENGEVDGVNGFFWSNEKLDFEIKKGNIAIEFNEFGGRYAYLKSEVFSEKNHVFEMHYTHLDRWKDIKNNLVSIYILPRNIDNAIYNVEKRNLNKEKEKFRINEIYEQYNSFCNDELLRDKFDYIIYNDFNDDSIEEIMLIIERILN